MFPCQSSFNQHRLRQRGASLIVVMMILVIVSLLGIGAAQIALMGERGARNDRDMQMAWQAAEAALIDAELEMTSATATRQTLFNGQSRTGFIAGCGTSVSDKTTGLCDVTVSGNPAWVTVDFTNTAANAPTVAYGTFTSGTVAFQPFAFGTAGVQPAQAPRYIIELLPDPANNQSVLYRVTAMGFGPRVDIQAVLQMIFRV